MEICDFCNFKSCDKKEFQKHYNRVECKQSRTYLFVCKRCDFIGHTFQQIKTHNCKKMYFEFNVVERLRRENSLYKSILSENTELGPVLTTAARTEWSKMQTNIKELQKWIPDMTAEKLNTKSMIEKCKQYGVPVHLVYAIVQQSTWLNAKSPDLGNFNLKSLLDLKKKPYDTFLNYYFDFTIERPVDFEHYFKLLMAKTECMFWPFLISNEKIVELIFSKAFCPLRRTNDGSLVILKTNDNLQHALCETVIYKNWSWRSISYGDCYRFLHHEWIESMFKNIILILEQIPNLLDKDYYSLEQSKQSCKEKLDVLFPHLLTFLKYWNNPEKCINPTILQSNPELIEIKFNILEKSFESLIKEVAVKGFHRGWEPIIDLL